MRVFLLGILSMGSMALAVETHHYDCAFRKWEANSAGAWQEVEKKTAEVIATTQSQYVTMAIGDYTGSVNLIPALSSSPVLQLKIEYKDSQRLVGAVTYLPTKGLYCEHRPNGGKEEYSLTCEPHKN